MRRSAKISLAFGMGLGSLALIYIFVALWMQPKLAGTGAEGKKERTFRNCCLLEADGTRLRFLYDYQEYEMELSEEYQGLSEELESLSWQLADLQTEDGVVVQIRVKQEALVTDQFTLEEGQIRIGDETYALDEEFRAYDRELGQTISLAQLGVYNDVRFLLQEGRLAGAIASDSQVPDIRVALTDSSFLSHEHSEVILSADTAMTVTYRYADPDRAEESRTVSAGEKLTFAASEKDTYSQVLVKASGSLRVESLLRSGQTPEYEGSLELFFLPEGIWLVNELPLEEYLCGVLPSEIPSTYEKEAMKAQAICARSYAYAALNSPKYPEVSAHVDDSTNSQVYNNTKTTEAAREAVAETTGQMLWSGDRLVSTYYYSTSCGVGAAVSEVWSEADSAYLVTSLHAGWEEPSEMVSKLLSAMSEQERAELKTRVDLSQEVAFRAFLDEALITISLDNLTIQEELKPYEEQFLWYRWHAKAELSKLSESVNANLALYAKTFEKVQRVTDLEGKEKEEPSVGTIRSIEVTKRGKSGIAMEVVITGSEGIATLTKQTAIRTILSLQNEEIVRQDGEAVSGVRLLPSAFFYVDCGDGTASFTGGGYGHGVGMSQNGANEMAKEGMSCEELLEHFFPGTELRSRYGAKSS